MWPTVRDGDTLLVDRTAACSIGDIIVLRLSNDDLLAHRLVMDDGCRVRCANARGDLDPWVDCDAVMGRVAAIERDGKLIEVRRRHRGTRVLWAVRSGYGLARRAAARLRGSIT